MNECPNFLPHCHRPCPPTPLAPWTNLLHILVYPELQLRCLLLDILAGKTPYCLGIAKHCPPLEGHAEAV